MEVEWMSTYPRTTLFVVEKEDWINAKSTAERIGYDSVSEYIFSLLKADQEYKISYYSLLLELEKYYELKHYTLGLTADRAGFSETVLIYLMQDFGLPFPEEKSDESCELIHGLLFQYNIIPREVNSILRLKEELQRRRKLSSADILCSIFPDNLERTTEVLTLTRDLVFPLIENITLSARANTLRELCRSCMKNIECNEKHSDLRSLFGKFALEYDAEALDNDPILETLRKANCIQLFGRMLEYASINLMKRELERIENFQSRQSLRIEMSEMEELKAGIDKMKEQFKSESSCLVDEGSKKVT